MTGALHRDAILDPRVIPLGTGRVCPRSPALPWRLPPARACAPRLRHGPPVLRHVVLLHEPDAGAAAAAQELEAGEGRGDRRRDKRDNNEIQTKILKQMADSNYL